jgi:hypothetical protein
VNADRARLEPAYLATSYVADTPVGRLALRVGKASPELDRLLAAAGATAWAFVTACNPGSRRLSDAENAGRTQRLRDEVEWSAYAVYRGEGVGDAGDWPPEAGVLILGMAEAEALELARRYGQAAIVVGEMAGVARLAWV